MKFTTQSFPFFKTSLEDMEIITIGTKDKYNNVCLPNRCDELILNTKYYRSIDDPRIIIGEYGECNTLGIRYNFYNGIIGYELSAITSYEKESDRVLRVKLHPEEFLYTGDVITNEDYCTKTFVIVKCTIPKGTEYFEKDGRVLTDCVIPTSFEEIV